ncbi:MAG TPA: gluconate 2-dehydrogenase subunit 3 family protein [Vicinamibacterales bacterium]|nr:gluconate 2-dehydrogenase subunit 3 family protein [Vicinamibacterales bacterium]
MSQVDRRTMMQMLAAAPAAALFTWTEAEAAVAVRRGRAAVTAAQAGAAFQPAFFTAHEWQTVRVLVDLILPKDARSGSATDAGVPEFMDFMMVDQPTRQLAMRGGLAWLDREMETRFDRRFADASDTERRALLDDVAWPGRARPEMSHGVRFFATFRDLTASGFWTSKMGIEDLGYQGNVYLSGWDGCPPEVLKRLGVSN